APRPRLLTNRIKKRTINAEGGEKAVLREYTYTVPPEFDGEKLLRYLRNGLSMSARTVTKLRHDPGSMTNNGLPVRTIDPVHAGDTLRIILREPAVQSIPAGECMPDIIYADNDVLVINKPAMLAVHPTHNHQGDTLANQTAAYLAQNGQTAVFRAVGRLDKSTSGLVLCALNRHAASVLSGSFQKTYLAIAEGELSGFGTIDAPIMRPDPDKTLRAVGPGGDKAVTHWESLACGKGLTLLRLHLETGRTHQIRVHMAHMGHMLAGDEMYGGHTDLIARAALHCETLSFCQPVTGEAFTFTVPPPADMQALIRSFAPAFTMGVEKEKERRIL
ncbi:MAG: RluA family pseudouridine synthase, partial [Clostridia bacterium]|nr:RluA family pseudouridine synthase [Clostridia bacterium]